MDENDFLPNIGIIPALLQTLNKIFQNKKISTIIYSVCVCVGVLGLRTWKACLNYDAVWARPDLLL